MNMHLCEQLEQKKKLKRLSHRLLRQVTMAYKTYPIVYDEVLQRKYRLEQQQLYPVSNQQAHHSNDLFSRKRILVLKLK